FAGPAGREERDQASVGAAGRRRVAPRSLGQADRIATALVGDDEVGALPNADGVGQPNPARMIAEGGRGRGQSRGADGATIDVDPLAVLLGPRVGELAG